MNENYFKDDNKKVLYYIYRSWYMGLAHDTLYVHITSTCKLSPFQQILITLMRLHLNLHSQDLGYRFAIHNSTISRYFTRVIEVLFVKLELLIRWPERNALIKTMPMAFRKHFLRCVVIFDCFEIFLDRPTHLLARAHSI